jgi:hypothetical protein
MLELRPTCEHCNKNLAADAADAMLCSFECTFCRECVEKYLENVCPNCGGGFCPRPVRPSANLRNGNYLGKYPASTISKHAPVNLKTHFEFAKSLKLIDPEKR